MFATNGILFNHESPRRGETFVTRKITRAVARIALGQESCLYLGNLSAERDWGHARDYVEGMWRIVQHASPDDWVLATGRTTTVRRFTEMAFSAAGIELAWEGSAEAETARRTDTGATVVRIDPAYYRPTEVELLLGDASKAERELGWRATTSLEAMTAEMVEADLAEVRSLASVDIYVPG